MARSSAPSLAFCFLVFLSYSSCPAHGSSFLGQLPDAAASQSLGPELQKALLTEIEEVLGRDHRHATEGRLGRLEKALRSTFAALPKNSHGRLGREAVRYALHRLFLQRHAWFVRGLEPGSEAWNSSSPTAFLGTGLPAYVQDVFEKRIGGRGLELHDVAVLAATLENLVRHETMQRLEHTYRVLERSPDDPLSLAESYEVVDAYMASYILGLNFTALTPAEAREKHSRIEESYPTWPDTQKFVREVQAAAVSKKGDFTFERIASVVEEIGEQYGRWQDKECRALKEELIAVGEDSTGRVRLADFYGSAIYDGKWQFSESVAFLRQLGALDESDPDNLRVLISNYITSPSNCVASSSYYSVCCLDECEGILSHLEEKLGRHDATPGEVTSLITFLPETSGVQNRALSQSLLARLEDVAKHHGGRIPLHGRLFAQWLHQAYPRECPFPHISGTTKPQRAEEWIVETGIQVSASSEEMRQYVDASPRRQDRKTSAGKHAEEQLLEDYGMWTMQEELIVRHEAPEPVTPGLWDRGALRGVCFVAAVLSTTLMLLQIVSSSLSISDLSKALPKQHQHKYRV